MTLPFKDPRLKTKRIIVWENGDYFGDGHPLGINSEHFRTWKGILAMVTDALKPSFGEVKSLIEVKSRIPLKSFDDFVENGKYVAVGGKERFRMSQDGCYLTPEEKQARNTYYTEQKNASLTKSRKKNIFVMPNGRTQVLPCKVVFGEMEIVYWYNILAMIAETLDIPQGIQCLYDVYGNAVPDPRTLGNGCIYVAVAPNETFVNIDYVGSFKNMLPMREIDMVKIEGIVQNHPNPYAAAKGASKTSIRSSRMKLAGGSSSSNKLANRNYPDQKADPRLRQILGVDDHVGEDALSHFIPANNEDAEKQRAKERERESRERIKLLSNVKLRTMPTSGINPLPKIDEVLRSSIDTGSCDLEVDPNARSEPIIITEDARSASQMFESRSPACGSKPAKAAAQTQKSAKKPTETPAKRTIQTQKSDSPQCKPKSPKKVPQKESKNTQTKSTESKKTETKCTETKKTENKGCGTNETEIKNACQTVKKLEQKDQCQSANNSNNNIGTIILEGYENSNGGSGFRSSLNGSQTLRLPCNVAPEVFFRTQSGINIGISLLSLEPSAPGCSCSIQSSPCSSSMGMKQPSGRGCNNRVPSIVSANSKCSDRKVSSRNTNHIVMPCKLSNVSNFNCANCFLPNAKFCPMKDSKNNVIDKDWPPCLPYGPESDPIMPISKSYCISDLKKNGAALQQSTKFCVQDILTNKIPVGVTPGCGGGAVQDNQRIDSENVISCHYCGQPREVTLLPVPVEDKSCTSDVQETKTISCGKDIKTETVDASVPGCGSCDKNNIGDANAVSSEPKSVPKYSSPSNANKGPPIKNNISGCGSCAVQDNQNMVKTNVLSSRPKIVPKCSSPPNANKSPQIKDNIPGCGSCAVQDNQNIDETNIISSRPKSVPKSSSPSNANQGASIKNNIAAKNTLREKNVEVKTNVTLNSKAADIVLPSSGAQYHQNSTAANVVMPKSTNASKVKDPQIKSPVMPKSQPGAVQANLKSNTANVVTPKPKNPPKSKSPVNDNSKRDTAKIVPSKSKNSVRSRSIDSTSKKSTLRTQTVDNSACKGGFVEVTLKISTKNDAMPCLQSYIVKNSFRNNSADDFEVKCGGCTVPDNQKRNSEKDVLFKTTIPCEPGSREVQDTTKKSPVKEVLGDDQKRISASSLQSKPKIGIKPKPKFLKDAPEIIPRYFSELEIEDDDSKKETQSLADTEKKELLYQSPKEFIEDVIRTSQVYIERSSLKKSEGLDANMLEKLRNIYDAEINKQQLIEDSVPILVSSNVPLEEEKRQSTDSETLELVYNSPAEFIDDILRTCKEYIQQLNQVTDNLDNIEKLQRLFYTEKGTKKYFIEESLSKKETRPSIDSETSGQIYNSPKEFVDEIIKTGKVYIDRSSLETDHIDKEALEKLRNIYNAEANKKESLPSVNLVKGIPLEEGMKIIVSNSHIDILEDTGDDILSNLDHFNNSETQTLDDLNSETPDCCAEHGNSGEVPDCCKDALGNEKETPCAMSKAGKAGRKADEPLNLSLKDKK